MKQRITAWLLALGAVVITGVLAAPFSTVPVSAQIKAGLSTAKTDELVDKPVGEYVPVILNVMLYIVSITAVIMVVVGGIKYTTSGGDSNKIQSAKNTITYAIVGLVIAIFAWAIINWVVKAF